MKVLNQLKTVDKIANFSGTLSSNTNNISVNAWIIDSGASDHIICHEYLFSSTSTKLDSIYVQLPNGNITDVKKIGTVHLSPNIILKNVLYISEF